MQRRGIKTEIKMRETAKAGTAMIDWLLDGINQEDLVNRDALIAVIKYQASSQRLERLKKWFEPTVLASIAK